MDLEQKLKHKNWRKKIEFLIHFYFQNRTSNASERVNSKL